MSWDGGTLAIGTVDGTAETFDTRTLAVRHPPVVVAGGSVQSVDFSPDGQTIVVGGADAEMSLWNTATLTRIGPPIVGTNTHNASWWAWFTPSGDITGLMPQADEPVPSTDGRAFTFPGHPQAWITATCQLAGGGMSPAQWAGEIPDQPYRQLC